VVRSPKASLLCAALPQCHCCYRALVRLAAVAKTSLRRFSSMEPVVTDDVSGADQGGFLVMGFCIWGYHLTK
jgi:hypothetical protein